MINRHSNDFTTEHARVMEVMDCVASHAETPDGLPVAIIKMAYQGELEQPMLISLRDTRSLLLHLVAVLAEHGDPFAKELTKRYFTIAMSVESSSPPRSHNLRPKASVTLTYPKSAESFVVNEPPERLVDRSAKRPPKSAATSKNWAERLAGSSAMNVKFTVKYGQSSRLKNKFYLFGGYTLNGSTYILARRRTSGGGVQDGILRLLPNQQVELHPHATTLLPPQRWANFLYLRGSEFRIDTGVCHKLADAEAKALVADRIFRCA